MTRWIAILTAAGISMFATTAMAANSALSLEANNAYLAANSHKPGVRTMRDGLQYRPIQLGNGLRVNDGDVVTVNYTLSLINGDKIQGTEPDFPTQFPVDNLIPGWREALKNMRVGDHWALVVPATLGYGPRGTVDGLVPPNQVLVFDIELLAVRTPPKKKEKEETPDTAPAAGNTGNTNN